MTCKELKGAVVARRARDGEKVLALNEKEYVLDRSMTVIADDAQVHDIGGIMGGEHSGVSETTTDTLARDRLFHARAISPGPARSCSLTSDARSRFERGVDPAFLDDGLAILTGLILDICGGEASRVTRAGEPPVEDEARPLRSGADRWRWAEWTFRPTASSEILERLGFRIEGSDAIVPELAPRHRRPGRPGRGSHPHRRL